MRLQLLGLFPQLPARWSCSAAWRPYTPCEQADKTDGAEDDISDDRTIGGGPGDDSAVAHGQWRADADRAPSAGRSARSPHGSRAGCDSWPGRRQLANARQLAD